ncbi:MAG: helix-turn-helix transcriptional regulator [Elusimicrobia bacterium]|jgi:DNA-binding XRE family transcriptional regulator|nr:helix-turn-helix transcriptional regulator [Elusimicrobiota bacterium]
MIRHKEMGASVQTHFKKKMMDPKFRRLYQAEEKKVRLGYVIHRLRTEAGLTQAALAQRVGVTQGYIARLETADEENYEMNTLKKIAAALHRVVVIGFAEEPRRHSATVSRRANPLVTV